MMFLSRNIAVPSGYSRFARARYGSQMLNEDVGSEKPLLHKPFIFSRRFNWFCLVSFTSLLLLSLFGISLRV